jgi:MFS family permease
LSDAAIGDRLRLRAGELSQWLRGRRPLRLGWFPRVLLVNLLLVATLSAMRPMVSYRAVAIGAGPAEVGLLAASFGIISLIIAVPAGRWVDRYGEPVFIVAGTATVAVVALVFASSSSLVFLAIAMAALGSGQIIAAASIQTLIANAGTPEGRDGRFGAHTVVASFGQLIGPVTAGTIVANAMRTEAVTGAVPLHATDGVFWAGAAASIVSLAVAISLWQRPPREGAFQDRTRLTPDQLLSTRSAILRVFRVPSMPQAMLASLTVLSSVDILVAYLPLYGVAFGIPVETIALLLAARGAASMTSRAVMLPLLRRLGRRRLIVGSMLVPAATLVTVPWIGAQVGPLLAAMILIGFGLGLGQPLTMSWVATRAPIEIRGTALGARLSANRFGQFALPATVGLLAGTAGLLAIFWSLAALLLISAAFVARAPFDAPKAIDATAADLVDQKGGASEPLS